MPKFAPAEVVHIFVPKNCTFWSKFPLRPGFFSRYCFSLDFYNIIQPLPHVAHGIPIIWPHYFSVFWQFINKFWPHLLFPQVFQVIKTDYPQSLSKIRPIIGDCLKSGLGLTPTDRDTMTDRVNVIFHVAATVRFDAPLRNAVHMNIRSTSDMLDLAHEMKQLKVTE